MIIQATPKTPMSLAHHLSPHPPSSTFLNNLHFSKPHFLSVFPKPNKSLSLLATSNTTPVSTDIFLPFLTQKHDAPEPEQAHQCQNQANNEKEEEDDSSVDPMLKFFKSRTSTQDPAHESKITLQKNRRSSWHIAPENDDDDDDDFVSFQGKIGIGGVNSTIEDMGVAISDPDTSIVEEIAKLARNLLPNLTLGEVLGPYVKRVSDRECVEVLSLMGQEGLVMGCCYFFEWMGLQEPTLVTPRACSVLFPVLGKAGMGDTLLIMFRNLPKRRRFMDVHVYNAAMSGLLDSRRYHDACKVYEEMETNNVQPDHVTCSIMITIMRKNGGTAKEAWEFFERMNRKGVEWHLDVLGPLIKSFCDEGLVKEALIIQSEMEKRGVSSNALLYNTLMNAYCKSNHVEEAEGLFTEMTSRGLMPTSATYNILMDAYSRRMQPEIVENLMSEMQNANLEPSAISYTCLISAYGRQKRKSDMAADAFLRMKKLGIKPTSHTYTALIHAYSVSGWHEKAYTTFENMRREGVKPSIETYTALLDAFRRAGDTETLMDVWKLMISEKIEGTRVTFNMLLDGFSKQGHYVEARDVISEFGKIGLQPTVMTYNMLMNAYARGGQHPKLPQLLKEMAALNIKPDSITYSTMIYAYVRVRDFKRAFLYHKQMVKSKQLPDANSYQKLREILNVKAATKNRKDKSAILGILNSKMGMVKPKKKGKKDEFWKKRPWIPNSERD